MNDKPDEKSELRKRFVWKWHPHGWLTLVIVILLIFLFIKLAQ